MASETRETRPRHLFGPPHLLTNTTPRLSQDQQTRLDLRNRFPRKEKKPLVGLIIGLEMGQISHFFVGPNLYLVLSHENHQRIKLEEKPNELDAAASFLSI